MTPTNGTVTTKVDHQGIEAYFVNASVVHISGKLFWHGQEWFPFSPSLSPTPSPTLVPSQPPTWSPTIPPTAIPLIQGSGGTTTIEAGGWAQHVFASSGTFTLPVARRIDYIMLVGGGGGCGNSQYHSGGGGAGGLVLAVDQMISAGAFSLSVGNGGSGTTNCLGTSGASTGAFPQERRTCPLK